MNHYYIILIIDLIVTYFRLLLYIKNIYVDLKVGR